jgi:hypothetical protein
VDTEDLRRRLIAKAHLFADPDAYVAGVNDALETFSRIREWEDAMRTPAEGAAARADQFGTPALSSSVRSRNDRAG